MQYSRLVPLVVSEGEVCPRLKVIHLTSVHAPSDVRIFRKECSTLAKAGYDVSIIAPCSTDHMLGQVKVKAVPVPKNRLERMLRTAWRVYKRAVQENASIYHFHDPELLPFGILLKLRGKSVIYDVHEDLPRQVLSKDWIPQRFRKIASWLSLGVNSLASRLMDAIVAATPAIAQGFRSKVTVVQNFPLASDLDFRDSQAGSYDDRPSVVAYVGGITAIRGARELITGLGLVPDSAHVKLALVGKFEPDALQTEIAQMPGWDRVEFFGWRSREEVNQLLAGVRAGIVTFHPVPNHIDAQPNKLFEYMAAGIPVIASDFPLWRQIISEAGCGLLVNPLDPQALAGAIDWILQHPERAAEMGQSGYEAVRSHYNWDTEAIKLLELYSSITSLPGRTEPGGPAVSSS